MFTLEELRAQEAAMAHYQLKEYPLGRSSYSAGISLRDGKEWQVFFSRGVWLKLEATIYQGWFYQLGSR